MARTDQQTISGCVDSALKGAEKIKAHYGKEAALTNESEEATWR